MLPTRRPRAAAFRHAALALALTTALGGLTFVPATVHAAPEQATSVDIPYETFTVRNGLRVVVHTDR